jgi:hypothetical protein
MTNIRRYFKKGNIYFFTHVTRNAYHFYIPGQMLTYATHEFCGMWGILGAIMALTRIGRRSL